MQTRENALNIWLNEQLKGESYILKPLTGDASFRRYYRLNQDKINLIVMDAPPEKESIESFIKIAALLKNMGIHTPEIIALDKALGFIILEDLGDQLLLGALNPDSVDRYYLEAMNVLNKIECSCDSVLSQLPSFDKPFILKELSIFTEWFLGAYLKIQCSHDEQQLIKNTFEWLSNELINQPQTFIHRDYHSRNLMLLNDKDPIELGVIDFQDAMQGPITYDLVSLIKDCYIQWPKEDVNHWIAEFYKNSPKAQHYDLAGFTRAVDLCGLQRHLKVLGVFSRLYLRDNKPGYLNDLPLTLHYVMACLENYPELGDFYQFMQQRIRLP